MSKRVTVKGVVVAADRDDESLRLSMLGNDMSALLSAGAFLRVVEVSLPPEEGERNLPAEFEAARALLRDPEQPAPWQDKGVARRMIDRRIHELSQIPLTSSDEDVMTAHIISGEIRALNWVREKFTVPE